MFTFLYAFTIFILFYVNVTMKRVALKLFYHKNNLHSLSSSIPKPSQLPCCVTR